ERPRREMFSELTVGLPTGATVQIEPSGPDALVVIRERFIDLAGGAALHAHALHHFDRRARANHRSPFARKCASWPGHSVQTPCPRRRSTTSQAHPPTQACKS